MKAALLTPPASSSAGGSHALSCDSTSPLFADSNCVLHAFASRIARGDATEAGDMGESGAEAELCPPPPAPSVLCGGFHCKLSGGSHAIQPISGGTGGGAGSEAGSACSSDSREAVTSRQQPNQKRPRLAHPHTNRSKHNVTASKFAGSNNGWLSRSGRTKSKNQRENKRSC